MRHDELIRVRQQIRYLAFGQLLARRGGSSADFSLYELSIFSQNGEDGVLEEIFKRIGVENKRSVEIGASVNESNAMFLADVLGWSGMFIDASSEESSALSQKYHASERVKVERKFITPTNFAETLVDAGYEDDFDLLSIDVDGNDLWLWRALSHFRPRVIVIEYNSALP